MKLSGLLQASHACGGPYKLLLIQFRGGQFIGAILALACYAWLIANLSSRGLPIAASPKALVALGTYVSVYLLVLTPATWRYFDQLWFDLVNIAGDVLAIAGSIAIAVLTRGATSNCSTGLFVIGEEPQVPTNITHQACKLQKVVFATGISNSIIFSITSILYLALHLKWLDRHAGKSGITDVEKANSAQRKIDVQNGNAAAVH